MHAVFAGHRISIIPNEWHERLSMILCYFARGPLVGIGQQVEPDIQPNRKAGALVVLLIVLALMFLPIELTLAMVWLVISPALLYTFSTVPETVYEHRGYLSLLGVAGFAAWSAEKAPRLVVLLAMFLAVRTILRTRQLRTTFGFWRLAYQESPDHWRTRFNYAQQLQINGHEFEAVDILKTLFDAPRPCGEVAAQHLAAIYLKRHRLDEAAILLGARGEAILKFPNSAALRVLRGNFLKLQGNTEQAELAYQVARTLV